MEVHTLSVHTNILGGFTMEITAKEFRGKPSQIIEQASRGTEVIITIRGKKRAKLIPYKQAKKNNLDVTDQIFGLWKDHNDTESVDEYVRSLRKRRKN
jgi:prevent-host-death family protein